MAFLKEMQDFSNLEILTDEPMKKHTALAVGGNAKYLVKADSLYILNFTIQCARRHKIPYRIIGNGSNVIVGDKGFNGVIILVGGINSVFFKLDKVNAMCGASLAALLRFCVVNRLEGAEFLTGIPGTVGGGIVSNAGAFGKSLSDVTSTVDVLKNGKIVRLCKEDCRFGYRKSRFSDGREVIVSATFDFKKGDKTLIEEKINNNNVYRKQVQPSGRSCGSVFKKHGKISAGELIEKAGLKGLRHGGAVISEKHANFIINERCASASDVRALIDCAKEKVKTKFGITLKEEVVFLGEF